MNRREFMIGTGMCLAYLGLLQASLDDIKLKKIIKTESQPKSVEFSPDMEKGYINNLEGCSTWVLNSNSYELEKIIRYNQTPVVVHAPTSTYKSFEEKPVETCFTHNGERVWISLHNAGGIVIKNTNDVPLVLEYETKRKKAVLEEKSSKKEIELSFIKTGETPKILRATPDGKRVCVANWHNENVTVLDSETGKNYGNIPVGYVPRGMVYSKDSQIGFIANMVGNSITIFDVYGVKRIEDIKNIGSKPRHLVIDYRDDLIYVSFHGDGYLRRFDIKTRKLEKELYLGGSLRSMASTPSGDYLFVDCFSKNKVFVVDSKNMKKVDEIKSEYHPVGIAYNNKTKEVWVVNQNSSTLNIYGFKG